jgi:hypothetical protein
LPFPILNECDRLIATFDEEKRRGRSQYAEALTGRPARPIGWREDYIRIRPLPP